MGRNKTALIVVDVQNDFCQGGALAVPQGSKVVSAINNLIELFYYCLDGLIIFTQDWHPPDHCSFKENGGVWPKHCVQGTRGAELHRRLKVYQNSIFIFIKKGTDKDRDAYSGFEGTELKKILRDRKVRQVFICGLATDYCVKATALDAEKAGFETFVNLNACRGVNVKEGDVEKAIKEMSEAGIKIITSEEMEMMAVLKEKWQGGEK